MYVTNVLWKVDHFIQSYNDKSIQIAWWRLLDNVFIRRDQVWRVNYRNMNITDFQSKHKGKYTLSVKIVTLNSHTVRQFNSTVLKCPDFSNVPFVMFSISRCESYLSLFLHEYNTFLKTNDSIHDQDWFNFAGTW